MSNLREIRVRIKAVNNIKHVTDAIQKIAAARLFKARSRLADFKKYFKEMKDILNIVLGPELLACSIKAHELALKNKNNTILLIVITGDRGFCGSYNMNVFEASLSFLKKYKKENIRLIVLGKKGASFFNRMNYTVIDSRINLPGYLPYSIAEEFSEKALLLFLKEQVSEVNIISTELLSLSRSVPSVKKLLPFDTEPMPGRDILYDKYIYEPQAEKIAGTVLTQYIKLQIWLGILESIVSENAARVFMMERATLNAEEMIDELRLTGNKIRQAGITKELADIVGSAESLT